MTRAAYCKEHNLSYHAATYWSGKFSQSEQGQTNLVPVKLPPNIEFNSAQATRTGLKVILPNKIAIEIDDDFSAETLKKLLTVLEKS